MGKYATKLSLTPSEARIVLGTTAKDMSDEAIRLLINQVDVLTDIVAAHSYGSIINSCIANSRNEPHNDS